MHTIAEDLKIALSIKNLQEQNIELKQQAYRYCPEFNVHYMEQNKTIRVSMKLADHVFTYDLSEDNILYHDIPTLASISGDELCKAFKSKICEDIIPEILKAVANKKIIESKL